jgi:hypothetical protein
LNTELETRPLHALQEMPPPFDTLPTARLHVARLDVKVQFEMLARTNVVIFDKFGKVVAKNTAPPCAVQREDAVPLHETVLRANTEALACKRVIVAMSK